METNHIRSVVLGWLNEQAGRELRDVARAENQTNDLVGICAKVLNFKQLLEELVRRKANLQSEDGVIPPRTAQQQEVLEDQEARAELLAWMTYYYAEDRGRRPWGDKVTPGGIEDLAESAYARYKLILGLAQAQGRKPHALCGDLAVLNGLLPLAHAFTLAVLPTRLGVLVRQPEFRARLQAWLDQRLLSDADFTDWLAQVWLPIPGMDPAGLVRLIAKVTLPLLRTYPEDKLEQTARLFVQYEPLADYIVRGGSDPQLDRELVPMLTRLERRLRAIGEAGNYDAEDAVYDALLMLIQKAGFPLEGYLYRAPIDLYLGGVAENYLRREIRLDQQFVADPHGMIGERAGGGVAPRQARRLEANEEAPRRRERQARGNWMRAKGWNERFQVVLSFNKLPTRERARAIWRAIREATEGAEKIDDRLLCVRIVALTGRPLQVATLQNARWRLRQRMFVLDYVLDQVPAGAPDLAGDVSLLAALAEKDLAASAADRPTIRQLAALARAVRDERTVGWVLLCRLLLEPLGLGRAEALAMAGGVIEAAEDRVRGELGKRIERIVETRDADKRSGLNPIYQFAREKKILFFLVPAWYLIRVRGLSVQDAFDRLQPENALAEILLNLLERLGAFGAIAWDEV